MRDLVNGRGYDRIVGAECRCVLAGECALMRVGLTSLLMDHMQAWTLYPEINECRTVYIDWYFNPFAKEEFDTKPSVESPNILEPTQERALIEYILFKDYFNEGILIEGLKSYMFIHDGNVQPLYDEAIKFSVPKDIVDYWLQEAREDYDD